MARFDIANIAISGSWEIDPTFGWESLSRYFATLESIDRGLINARDLYSIARQNTLPRIITADNAYWSEPGSMGSVQQSGSIAHLHLSGVMQLDDQFCSPGIRSLISDLNDADANPNISGILLEVNSGGGESAAGSELQNAISDILSRGRTEVAVYAITMASAALRATLPASIVYANSASASIGSVGTMVSIDRKQLKEVQDRFLDIYAAQSTEKNIELRALEAGDDGPMVEFLTERADKFVREVTKYRDLSGDPELRSKILAGKVVTADIAAEMGLIDGIATTGEVLEVLRQKIKTKNGRGSGPQKSQPMNFRNIAEFAGALIPSLREKFGLDIDETASPDELIEALQAAEGVNDVSARVDTLSNEIGERVDTLAGRVASLEETLDQFVVDNTELRQDNERLSKSTADLEGQLADLKGQEKQRAAAGDQKTAPPITQFNTFFEPENDEIGAKY